MLSALSPSGGMYAGGGVSAGKLYGEPGPLIDPSGDWGACIELGEYTSDVCEPP